MCVDLNILHYQYFCDFCI